MPKKRAPWSTRRYLVLAGAVLTFASVAMITGIYARTVPTVSADVTMSRGEPASTSWEKPAWAVWPLPQNRVAAQMEPPDLTLVPQPLPPPAAVPVVPPTPPSVSPAAAVPAAVLGPTSPAWRLNAGKASADDGRPMIAILIDDVGVARQNAELAIALDAPVTLSFMTYASDAPAQVAAARARGHEIMLHVPMEPLDHREDPGPNPLAVGLAPAELSRRIVWSLGRFDGFVGINNHMGSRFTADPDGMSMLMEALKRRGLLFVDSRTTASTVGTEMARRHGVPTASRDVFLDNEVDTGDIEARLAETERRARAQGAAIAIGHPHPETIATLRRWIPQAQARGFVLVPVSAVVARGLTD